MRLVVGSRVTRQVTFVGPFGVGKTTAVFTLCGASVTSSEVHSSVRGPLGPVRKGRRLKATTTVGLEIGEWTDPDGRSVQVVGTPSQERFDLVRRSAMPRSAGVVLWLFGDHEHAELDAQLWLEFILQDVSADKVALAITRLGEGDEAQQRLAPYVAVAQAVHPGIPVLAADPRSPEDVEATVLAALLAGQVER